MFGLLLIVADNGIPYYELGTPLSMENDEYKRGIEEKNNHRKEYPIFFRFPLSKEHRYLH